MGRYQEFPQLVVAATIEAVEADPAVVVHPDCGWRVLLAMIQWAVETPAVPAVIRFDAVQAGQNGVDNQLFRCGSPLGGVRIRHNRVNLRSRLALIAVRPASRTAQLYHCSSTGDARYYYVALLQYCNITLDLSVSWVSWERFRIIASQVRNTAILQYHAGRAP